MDVDIAGHRRLRLAQELLELILDHLHCDLESLKRSALASKSFLPTCQRHLFSTFQITKSNVANLLKLFTPPSPNDEDDEDASLAPRIADLLNTYTTNLVLVNTLGPVSRLAVGKTHFPEFKNLEKITIKGIDLDGPVAIPSFLAPTCFPPSSKFRSVEFDFRNAQGRAILETFCILPVSVRDITFASVKGVHGGSRWNADSIRESINHQHLRTPDGSCPGMHHFSGTLKFRLGPDYSHGKPLATMLELKDLFKFSLKRITYELSDRASIRYLASLVDECKDTLQFLDIPVSTRGYEERDVVLRSFDFSHHRALRSIRIWTPADVNPDWLCEAISSIPRPSSTTPRVPPLRIELHISLPHAIMYPYSETPYRNEEPKKFVPPWIVLDTQLSQLIGLNPDTLSTMSATADAAAVGIILDISIPELTEGPGKGIASLMFPLLSGIEGLVRLV